MKAIWNDKIIAESDKTVIVEGNHYFPRDSVKSEYLTESTTKSVCAWKGTASYFSLNVEGKLNKDSVWYYPQPSNEAKQIKGYIAFWKGVEITD